jgi:hypothetical protein
VSETKFHSRAKQENNRQSYSGEYFSVLLCTADRADGWYCTVASILRVSSAFNVPSKQFALLVSFLIVGSLSHIQRIYYLTIHSYFFYLTTVRNEWSYTSVLPIRLYGLHKEKNTLYILCYDFIQCSVDDTFHAWLKEKEDETCCYQEQFERAYA